MDWHIVEAPKRVASRRRWLEVMERKRGVVSEGGAPRLMLVHRKLIAWALGVCHKIDVGEAPIRSKGSTDTLLTTFISCLSDL